MSTHAKLSPSAAARWLACPGSVAACEGLDAPSEAAARGTLCHEALAHALRGQPERWPWADLSEEERGWVAGVVRWVQTLVDGLGGVLHVEQRVPVGRAFSGDLSLDQPTADAVAASLWGTADGIVVAEDSLTVYDAKFGFERVEAAENPQLSLYAMGWAADHGWRWDKYRLMVMQPRDEVEPLLGSEVLTRDQLWARREAYAPRVRAALAPAAPRVPGDAQCRWCPFRARCPEAAGEALALAQREFSPAVGGGPPSDQLTAVLEAADRVRAFLRAAEDFAVKVLQGGGEVPGWKLVEGRKHRKWKDEREAMKVLRFLGRDEDDFAPRTLVSPARAEKLLHLQARTLDELAPRPPGEPTLAREDDPRPALAPEFKALDGSSEGE